MEANYRSRRFGTARRLRELVGVALITAAVAPLGTSVALAQTPPALPTPSSNVSVFVTGLNNPRGLKFGPDGALYVAEGGTGGSDSTAGSCDQVIPPPGPYTGSKTGARISKISTDGTRTTAVDNLPSSQTSQALGSLISGAADVAFMGNTLYGLLAGAGCSHGVAGIPNGVIRANADGSWTTLADLGAFQKANPVAKPEADDFEPDGTWYSLLAVNDTLYALEPNHGELDKVTLDGKVSRVVDISASQGHIVPTAVTYHDGNFYIGNLNTFPVVPGSSKILKVTPDGQVSVYATGLTTVLGVAFGSDGRLYVLEMSTAPGDPTPGTGMVVRMSASGAWETVASSLTLPTAMTFGPNGMLYVSHLGFGLPPGAGQIVKVDVNAPATTTPGGMPRTGEATDSLPVSLLALALALLFVGVAIRRGKMSWTR